MSSIDLEYEMLLMSLELYNCSVVPRNIVQKVISTTIHFSSKIFMSWVLNKLSHSCSSDISNVLDNLKIILSEADETFKKFKTEAARFQTYINRGLMINPVEQILHQKDVDVVVNDALKKSKKSITLHRIPLHWSLKLLFEIPGCFDLVKNYMEELKREKNIISNFTQGKLWKEKYATCHLGEDELLIPIFVYEDAFETGNGLGSHAGFQNLGGVYITIPTFPPHISSQLRYILLGLIFKDKDREIYGNRAIFRQLIAELNSLRNEGLVINVKNKKYKLFFQLGLLTGDNKGLNEIMGFDTNFTSGKCCRNCSANIDEIRSLCVEKPELIRSYTSYTKDLELNDCSKTGLKEACVFNDVSGFHVLDSLSYDTVHDEFLGKISYAMLHICDSLIYKHEYFKLEFLNERKNLVQKKIKGFSNAIPDIKREYIVTKEKLKMSAAENLNFARFFGIFVGSKVPEEAEEWKLYILLRQMIDIISSPRHVRGHLVRLKFLSQEFLYKYKKLYGNLVLKMHNSIHLFRIMEMNGPPCYYSTMRNESKHREHKLTAVTTTCRINLPKTICIKSQLKLAYLKLTGNLNPKKIIFDDFEEIDLHSKSIYFPSCNSDVISTPNVICNGLSYEKNQIFVIEMGDNDKLSFGKIVNIFVKAETVFLKFLVYTTLCFDQHLYAYHVKPTDTFIMKETCEIPQIHACSLYHEDDTFLIIPKYIL